MYLRYPVRNFRCPFCGTKMQTEEYKGWKPWICHGCSAELQFSQAQGAILQLCFFGVALVSLYLLGLRGWQLLGAALLAGIILTLILTGPLDRIFPRRLEPFHPPPWKKNKSTTIPPAENIDSDGPIRKSQSVDEPRKDSSAGEV
jgi:hypothetical protein